MNSPLISIIIPTYNRAHLIGETLDSILVQTYSNWECIVVDDGSIDETSHILENYSKKEDKFIYIVKELGLKKGASSCRNIGLRFAKGEFIQFIDSDDILASNKLEEQLKLLLTGSKLDIVTCKWGIFENSIIDGVIYQENYLYKNFHNILDYFDLVGQYGGFLPLHCFLINKKIIDRVGYWNEDLTVNDDGEFFFRILTNGSKVVFCSDTFVLYRKNMKESLSSVNSVEKAHNLIKSWQLIEIEYWRLFGIGESIYLDKKKESIYSSLKKSYPQLIKKNISFFKNQVENDNDRYNIKFFFRKLRNKLRFYLKKNIVK